MIGTLHDVVFKVSASEVKTFTNLSRQGRARYAKHEVVSTKPVLEFIGDDLDEISLNLRFDAALGVNPLNEITRLRDYKSQGVVLPLIIGGHLFGDFVCDSVSDAWDTVTNRGALTKASVSINLKEAVTNGI